MTGGDVRLNSNSAKKMAETFKDIKDREYCQTGGDLVLMYAIRGDPATHIAS